MKITFKFLEDRKTQRRKINEGSDAWGLLTEDSGGLGWWDFYRPPGPSIEKRLALIEKYLKVGYEKGSEWSIVKVKKDKKKKAK